MDVEALTLLRSATASLSSSTLDRLSLSSSSATAHITSDTSLVLDAIQHSVATVTVALSRKARLAHKQFIALSEEFDAHIKSLLCCYHQLTSNLIDEANDDTLWDSHQLLGAMLDTPLPSAYLSGGTLDPSALAIVDNISTFQSEVHVGRSAVFMPPSGLFRGSVNTVRIQCLDDSGEPVLCLSTNDIRAKLSPIEAVAGWEVGAPALEGSTVCISVIVSDDNACRDGRLLVTIAECSTIEIFLQVILGNLS